VIFAFLEVDRSDRREEDDENLDRLVTLVNAAVDAGVFDENGDELDRELRRQIVQRLVDEAVESFDDDDSYESSESSSQRLASGWGGVADVIHRSHEAALGHAISRHLVWTCGLQVVGNFVCRDRSGKLHIEISPLNKLSTFVFLHTLWFATYKKELWNRCFSNV